MAVQQAEPVALGLQVGRAVLGSRAQAAHRAHCPHHCRSETLDAEAGAPGLHPGWASPWLCGSGQAQPLSLRFLGVRGGVTGSFFVGGLVCLFFFTFKNLNTIS